MLFDFKANNFLCFVVPTTKKEDYLLIQYIVGGKYCTSIWHKWKVIYMSDLALHPETSQKKNNVDRKREHVLHIHATGSKS